MLSFIYFCRTIVDFYIKNLINNNLLGNQNAITFSAVVGVITNYQRNEARLFRRAGDVRYIYESDRNSKKLLVITPTMPKQRNLKHGVR